MKKLLALAFLFIFLPVTAHAHSGLSSSTPAEGESLDATPEEIRFQFESPIKQGTMALTDEAGNTIEISDISSSETDLIGQLNEELPNGAYKVDWSAISEDSHEITGTLTFNVAAEEAVEETATEDEATEETPETSESAEEAAAPAEEQASQPAATADDSAQGSSMWVTIIIVAILAIAAITFFVMARRK